MSSLQLYWLDVRSGENLSNLWGQVAGGLHRLQFVLDEINELRSASAKFNIENTIGRLENHLLSYLVRVYELRERIVSLTAQTCDQVSLVRKLKSKEKRESALLEIAQQYPSLSACVRSILELVDDDIELRNRNTHDSFLRLGLFINENVYDPIDAFMNFTDESERRHLENFLRKEVTSLSDIYYEKGEKVIALSSSLLEYCRPD